MPNPRPGATPRRALATLVLAVGAFTLGHLHCQAGRALGVVVPDSVAGARPPDDPRAAPAPPRPAAAGGQGGGADAARRHTFGLLNATSDAEWAALRARTLRAGWYADPARPLADLDDPDAWNARNMLPDFACPHLEQVPDRTRKGEIKHVCHPRRLAYDGKDDGCLVYSFGCAGDFSFEDALFRMHDKACEIHMFDPAKAWERKDDARAKNIHYHAWGLRSTYDDSKSVVWPKGKKGGFRTFPETRAALGHENRTLDVLKIDCEGCEWSTVRDWIGVGARQILVETHGLPSPQGTPRARWYQKPLNLTEYFGMYRDNGYVLFSKERNGKWAAELGFMKMADDFWRAP